MTDTTLMQVDSQLAATVDSSTTLENLTFGIRFYLLEVGKMLLKLVNVLFCLAKELVPQW